MATEPPGPCSHSEQTEESPANIQRRCSHPQRIRSTLHVLCWSHNASQRQTRLHNLELEEHGL